MSIITARNGSAQPFSALLKRATIQLIDAANDPLEREHRILIALEEGALTYPEAYSLRCGDDL